MMKTQIFLAMAIAAILPNSHCKTLAEGLRDNLANTKTNPTKENIMSLATEIAGNRKHIRLLDEDAKSATDDGVRELCQIPGHARYFADELESKRASFPPDDYKLEYHELCITYLANTLRYLPSPETVKVLGGYLSDERDAPPDDPRDWNGEPYYASVSRNAATGLAMLGLRDCPLPERVICHLDFEPMAKARAWYEEIESGKRAFSFRGQSVEYRFKPDGTWVTTPIANPPDDAPAPPPAKPAQPAPHQPPANTPTTVSNPLWPWITGGVLTVLAAVAYLLKSRTSHAG